MGDLSLQDVMNTVSRELEARGPAEPSRTPANLLDELSIFAALDPVLGDLQRQYKDARYLRRTQEKQFGKDDPMADVARDMEDSAWCAMQTRYMEVRGDRDLMREVQQIQNEQRETERRALEGQRRREALETYYTADMVARMHRRDKAPAILEWVVLLWIMRGQQKALSIMPSFRQLAA